MRTIQQNCQPVTFEQLRSALLNHLAEMPSFCSIKEISLLCPPKPIADDLTKLLVKDQEGKPAVVILCSPTAFPQLVAHYMEKTRLAQAALSPTLSHIVLTPLFEGEVCGLSYAVLPYHQPLREDKLGWYLQRLQRSPEMFKLVHQITELTCTPASAEEVETNFVCPLEHLIELEVMPEQIRGSAKDALKRLKTGEWKPRHVLMHNDFWKGNILLNRDVPQTEKNWQNRFVIIDWTGSNVKGYPIYDLIRLAHSMGTKPTALFTQLNAHCCILDCHFDDARSYFMAALGYLSMNLECFPLEWFVKCAKTWVDELEAVYCLPETKKAALLPVCKPQMQFAKP